MQAKVVPWLAFSLTVVVGCSAAPNTAATGDPVEPGDGGTVDAALGEGADAGASPFCAAVSCGSGTCNESERRCDCQAGFVFDPSALSCVQDRCADAMCETGALCDPETGQCAARCTPNQTALSFSFCLDTSESGYAAVIAYQGAGDLDLTASELRLNDRKLAVSELGYDAANKTLNVSFSGLTPGKYSLLLRLKISAGADLRPLFLPVWLGAGARYKDFAWQDAIMYQVMTDRFLNGDSANDLDNTQGTLAQVDDVRSQWQGGDFRGLITKIKDGYFTDMGINALWISSPLLNSHNSQPAVELADKRRFSSYHSYHPIVTGYTHLDKLGYDSPIEPAFGSEAELHELVNEAHARGIRVIPDFVANHVQAEAKLYREHKDWFFPYNACDGNWDARRVDCWFTSEMPDFDFGKPEAIRAVVDHALWLIQEYNFDGFRADALKHMDDAFVRALKKAVIEEVETTVSDHARSEEASVFYMVGESLGGWARYHVRPDMVQGQVDEEYYNRTKAALLRYERPIRDLAGFALNNDAAYRREQDVVVWNGSGNVRVGRGGYPGAIMGNFFGNHDQVRALTEAGGDHVRLRLAHTFLMTSPGNVPMLYQGDDIGTTGEKDPDNRKMHKFAGLSAAEQASLSHVRRAGKLREQHVALRRGTRETVLLEDYFWVYKLSAGDDVVYVALNRDADKRYVAPEDYIDGLGNCANGRVPSQSSCIFVRQ